MFLEFWVVVALASFIRMSCRTFSKISLAQQQRQQRKVLFVMINKKAGMTELKSISSYKSFKNVHSLLMSFTD